MGKPSGFLEYNREVAVNRQPKERVNDWQELYNHLPEEKIMTQAARCMECGTPFCHSGMVLNGATTGCPNHNLPPEWNDLVYRGLWQEAYQRLIKTNNFPEFTGRVCPALCEGACTVGFNGQAVAVKTIEYAIIEKAYAEGWVVPQPPTNRTGKKVAVVGSGPAGLACADELNKFGHLVTVFERADRFGGLLMYGIPNMKLDKRYVQRRIDLMAAEGVRFVPNTEVGTDYPAEQLLKEFDAVVLCGGARKPRDMQVEGRDLKGIEYAVDFLTASTKSLLHCNYQHDNYISAAGKDVIIIGGGDTGTDCVGTAWRHKCKSVVQFEIMPPPPKERAAHNPWPQYPRTLKIDYSQQEVIAINGADPRQYCIMTKKMVGDEQGNVKAVHTVNVQWVKNERGQLIPKEIDGTQRVWPAQLVLLAMGFLGPEDHLLDQLDIGRDQRGNAKATYGDFATNVTGVFVAGDMRRGQSLVIWAINEGRGAAKACNQYLMGD
ncbi:glutamate synthase subunit beta [Peptococcaceae bacterium 1198_IL3148]